MRAFRKRYFFNWGAKNLTKFAQKGKMWGEGLPARGMDAEAAERWSAGHGGPGAARLPRMRLGRRACGMRPARRFGRRGGPGMPRQPGSLRKARRIQARGISTEGGLRRRTDGARASLARPWRFGRFRRGRWSAVDFGARGGMQGSKRRAWVRGGGAGKLSEGDEAQGLGTGHGD